MAANVYVRGGIPAHVNGTSTTAVGMWNWPGGPCNYLWFKNTGAGALTLSFTEADATAGIGISVASGAVVELPVELAAFYTKSAASQTFQAVAFIRRG